jgi:D-glycero-alpha-D-manno-heptose 1-phosphate guanylyltransferase
MGTSESRYPFCAVVVLAGGLGTRLRSVTGDTPKPLVKILGRPFLDYLLDHLRQMGFSNFFVTASYRSDLLRIAVKQYSEKLDISIDVIDEKVAAGTFGAVSQAEQVIPGEFHTFLVINGDSLVDADYGQVVQALAGRDGVIGGVEVADCGRFGQIEADSDGRVCRFAEKVGGGAGTINTGIYALRRSAIRGVELDTPASMEMDFLPKAVGMLNIGLHSLGQASFIDIGTPESFAAAREFPLIKRLQAL